MSQISKKINRFFEQTSLHVSGDSKMQRASSIQGFWRNIMILPQSKFTAHRKGCVSQHLQWIMISLLLLTLYGCGNSVSNGENPTGTINLATGVATNLDPDVDLFYRNVYPLFQQRCVPCHQPGGNGNGTFAQADIVGAYNQATSRVDRLNPANSLFVTRVAGGHQCWDPNPNDADDSPNCSANATTLTTAISNWVTVVDPLAEQEANNSDDPATAEQIDTDILALLQPPNPAAAAAEQIVLGSTVGAGAAQYDEWIWGNTTNADPYISKTSPPNEARCGECHSESAPQQQRQQPYFADSDLATAFEALVDNRKIDINTPANSRLYKRLAEDSHNCWSDCASDAAEMLAAIQGWKDAILNNVYGVYSPPPVDGAGTTPLSNGLQLQQGQIISGGDRYRRNLVALWEFKEGSGNTVEDTSGVLPRLDLRLEGIEKTFADQTDYDYSWVGGYGIEFNRPGGRARAASTDASRKIYDLIAPRNEYSIEAWVVPDNVAQEGPAVIASYSAGNNNRNFTMGQTLYSYEFLNRNTNSGLNAANTANGQPTIITDPDNEDLQATQQHVVMTYHPVGGRKIYVNGQLVEAQETVSGGNLNNWDDGYLFVLGAETDGSTNYWKGKVRLFAIYNAALSQNQVTQNFDAGVGQKFNLLFKVGHLTAEMPDESYIWFEVAEFDSYAYLFANPRFVVLGDRTGLPAISTVISGMRIGVNGIEAPVGQVYLNMNSPGANNVNMTFDADGNPSPTFVDLLEYETTVVDGQTVSVPKTAAGTVISKINGPGGSPPDQFYLLFNQLGDQFGPVVGASTPDPLPFEYNPPVAGLADNTYISGIKMFEEINATMSEATGIPMSNSTVRNIYLEIQQALPSGVAMEGFLASHQISIARLALGYCGELVDNASLRSSYFPGFPFNETVANAFDTVGEQDIIVNALYDNMVMDNIASQPTRTETRDILFATTTGLYDQLAAGCAADASCTPDSGRTATVVKAMCLSVLSSAAMTVQ